MSWLASYQTSNVKKNFYRLEKERVVKERAVKEEVRARVIPRGLSKVHGLERGRIVRARRRQGKVVRRPKVVEYVD